MMPFFEGIIVSVLFFVNIYIYIFLLQYALHTYLLKPDKQLHVLAIGKETQLLHRLMEYGKVLSDQSVTYTAGNHLTGQVTSDRHGMAQYFIEGNEDLSVCANTLTLLMQPVLFSIKINNLANAVQNKIIIYLFNGISNTFL